jgi:putative peptidoglycan lipid II flippase
VSQKLKNIGIVSFLTVVSRILGLFRDQLAAAIFGAGALYSAFVTAFIVPNLFRRLLAEGSLNAAFVPTLQAEFHEKGRPGAFALLSNVVSWLLLVTGGLTVAACAILSHSRLITGQEPRWYLAADLSVLLFPYLALIALAAAFNAALNVMEHFTEPALSPIWLNIAMIVTLAGAGLHFAHTPMGEIHWLCAGVLVGGFFQMGVPAAVLFSEGWRPRFDLGLSPRVQEIALLMTPGLFGTAIYQINISVSRFLAFSLDDSSATLYFYGNRLMEFPIGVFAIAISTVVYPLLSRHAVVGDFKSMAEDYRKGLRLILIINVPAALGLVLLSHPITNVIYRHGLFTTKNASDLATMVALFSIGMPFFSIVNLTIRAFYSFKDTATPVKIAAIDFVVNIIISLSLMKWLGADGLVIASTTAIIVQTLLLQRALARKLPGMSFRPLWPGLGRVVLSTAVMGVAVWLGWHLIQRLQATPFVLGLAAIFVLIPIGVGVYAAMIWFLKIEGREELVEMLRRKKPGEIASK